MGKAIKEIADYYNKKLPENSIVAILNIKSDNLMLSNYIIGELFNNIVDMENLILVDRKNLELIKNEIELHLSGYVSDESAQAIGKILGAEIIISGEIYTMNKMYRLDTRAISVENAALMGVSNRSITIDYMVKKITGTPESFPISIGSGLYAGGVFSTGKQNEKGKETVPSLGHYLYDFETNNKSSKSALDIGGFIFFDLKYASINLFAYNSSGNIQWTFNKAYYYNNNFIKSENDNASGNFSATLFNIGILGKYPFYLNKITLYPALGADYQLWLLHAENGKRVPGDLSARNSIWIKLGGGADYNLTRSLFIRGELLWGAKLPSKHELTDSFTWFTHSPTIHIGIGYVFNR